MKTGCEGCKPGFCKRHKINKTENMVVLCGKNQDFFDRWEKGEGPTSEDDENFYPLGTIVKGLLDKVGVGKLVETVVEDCNCPERQFKLDHVIKRRK